MRALTHPVRLALIEALSINGPMTATEAGELIGESPTTCSFHLRQLAKYGYVEESGGGTGRRRPWKLVSRGMSFSGMGDAEQSIAADELARLLMDRWLRRHEQWKAVQHLDPQWADITGASEHVLYVTTEEYVEMSAQLMAVLDRYRDRLEDASARPDGSRPVEVVVFSHRLLGGDKKDSGE